MGKSQFFLISKLQIYMFSTWENNEIRDVDFKNLFHISRLLGFCDIYKKNFPLFILSA